MQCIKRNLERISTILSNIYLHLVLDECNLQKSIRNNRDPSLFLSI